jgi:predicted dehydrogenase
VSVRAETQPEIVKAAANAGVRMIFCEKPLATSADAAADVAQYCRAKGVSLVVNYWRRFDESHQRVRNLLTGGSCGSVQRFHCFYGNGLLTNGSHVVNLCLWYGGEVKRVTASFDRNDPECGDAVLEFESGARGTLSSVSYDAYRLLEVDVLGTTGRVALKNEGLDIELFGVEPNRDVHGAKQLAAEPRRIPSTVTEAFPRAITTMVSWLDADEHRAADDAVATLRVLDAIRSSARQDGRTVTLDAGTTYAQGAIR